MSTAVSQGPPGNNSFKVRLFCGENYYVWAESDNLAGQGEAHGGPDVQHFGSKRYGQLREILGFTVTDVKQLFPMLSERYAS